MRKTIAVLLDYIDHLHSGYESELRQGFVATAAREDLNLLIVAGRAIGDEPYDRIYRHVRHGSVDGVVLLAGGLATRSGPEALFDLVKGLSGTPLVSVGLHLPGVPSVVGDNRPGMRETIEHLIVEHGRSRVAFLAGPQTNVDANTRHDVYRQVLAANGIEYDPELVEIGPFTSGFGAQAVQKLLERSKPPDAIVASNDAMALGALQVLRTRGFRIPRDVALTGFDDLALARHVHPPLTTVRQPLERMGEAAIENLLRQMAGEAVPARLDLPVELVRRSSCGCDAELPRRTSIETADSAQDPLGWLDRNAERLIENFASTLALPRERGVACVSALIHGVRAELDGDEGALVVALDDVAATAGDRIDVFEELQVIVGALRVEFGKNPELEDTWHAARRSIAAAHSAEQSRRKMAVEASYWRLLASGERLSTAFDWPSLKAALADELPDMVENAFVSLYTDADERELRPFFCMRDGRVLDTGNARFPASELVPPGVLEDARRGTWFVLPLTYENDNLGIAVFDPGTGIGAHEMLRKQIGAALKSVALHREIVQKTTLHERSVQERLATAKRMSSLSVLAGGVAHDLNNALGPLVALPDVILQELDEVRAGRDDAELRSDVSTIKTAALRAAQTIKDLLALGRQGRTSREALDLTQVVRSCVATEQKTQPEGVSLELHVYPEPLVVQASDAQVARAVTNLVRNAVESLGGSGRVIVQTEAIRLVRPYAAYESIEPGDYAVVRVKDSGRGIEQGDLGRIFEPFFTKKRTSDSSGSGLGLSIVHGVVKEHDGFVDVVSEPGRGAEFTLYFRRSREVEPRRESRPSLVRGSATLLVVDDDPVQLRTARRVLARLGYEIETTRSGVEALAMCTGARARRFDLVIIDMLLNERDDGLAVFERLERLVPGQRGMIVSGHAPDERVRLATGKGLAWLAKPYGRDELARAVHAALSPASSSAGHSPSACPSSSARLLAGTGLEEPVAEGALALSRRPSQRP